MTRILLTSAIALGLAAPAFASPANDLARQLFAASESGNEARIVETSEVHSQRAVEILTALAAENQGNERSLTISADVVTVSSKGGINEAARAIFSELSDAD